VVRSGAHVETAVVDADVEVPADARIGERQPGATESTVRVALLGSAPDGPRPAGFVLAAGTLDPPDDDEDRSV